MFLEYAAASIEKRVIVGDEVICRIVVLSKSVREFLLLLRLAVDGMTASRIAIDVNPQNAREQLVTDRLGPLKRIVSIPFVAYAEVEKSIQPEEHAAAIVPEIV